MRSVACSLVVCLVVLAHAKPARADAPAADAVSAQVFFQRGRDAAARGDHAAACRAFEESLRLEVAVGTLFNLARCEEELGRLASAWQHLQEGIDRLDPSDPRRAPARASATALEARVPRLTVRLAAGADARVYRDGVELSPVSLGTPLPVNPGAHVIVVRAPGHAEARTELRLAERESRAVEVAPGMPEAAVSVAASAPPAEPRLRTPMWIAAGTATAAAGVALVGGGLAMDRSAVVEDHCRGTVCDAEGRSALEDGKVYGNVSTAAFVTAGVAAAAAAVFWFVGREPSNARAAHPTLIRF